MGAALAVRVAVAVTELGAVTAAAGATNNKIATQTAAGPIIAFNPPRALWGMGRHHR